MSLIRLEYRYYTAKPFKDNKVDGVFEFDSSVYKDETDNHWNMVSDHLQEQGIEPLAIAIGRVDKIRAQSIKSIEVKDGEYNGEWYGHEVMIHDTDDEGVNKIFEVDGIEMNGRVCCVIYVENKHAKVRIRG